MESRLIEYEPEISLKKYIDSYWFFRNKTNEMINFPVVPDGCSDIVFYLNNLSKLPNSDNTFVTGAMEFAELIPIPQKTELFGIRFRPGILSYFLETDMSLLKNNRLELQRLNKKIFQNLVINNSNIDQKIIASIDSKLLELFKINIIKDSFFTLIAHINSNLDISINELSLKTGISIKSIERMFNKRIGLSPKKYIRIMRFQKAHKKISSEGLVNLVAVALSSGYFDQPHFNREYKKLVGCNPNNETMSILYNT